MLVRVFSGPGGCDAGVVRSASQTGLFKMALTLSLLSVVGSVGCKLLAEEWQHRTMVTVVLTALCTKTMLIMMVSCSALAALGCGATG